MKNYQYGGLPYIMAIFEKSLKGHKKLKLYLKAQYIKVIIYWQNIKIKVVDVDQI